MSTHQTHTPSHTHPLPFAPTHTLLQVGNELTKYGTVTSVMIFEVTTPGWAPEETVRIFIQVRTSAARLHAFVCACMCACDSLGRDADETCIRQPLQSARSGRQTSWSAQLVTPSHSRLPNAQFDRTESATKAQIDLQGRYFGGRNVRVAFFDEGRFERTELAPQDGEFD
jgi:hypothetical protein